MPEEIQRYAKRLLFGHVEIQVEYIDYLFCVHGVKPNATLPSGVIFQQVSN